MPGEKNAGELSGLEAGEYQHSEFLDSIFQLDHRRRIKPATRKEPNSVVSEFALAPIKGTGAHVKALAKSVERHADLSERKVLDAIKVRKLVSACKTLPKPLESHESEKIHRVTGYSNLKDKVSRWDALVQANRNARCLTFPMNVRQLSSQEDLSGTLNVWKTRSPTALETEIYKVLGNTDDVADEGKGEKHVQLTLQELKERRKEIAKLRIQQSYQEAKARRQKRIKSKKYHRILRREKMKKQLQNFELLQKTDPEAALAQLEQLEKARAEERMTLRHKSTGRWAHNRLVRAKYDTLSRQQLAEQLAVGRDLMKAPQVADSEDEEREAIPSLANTPNDAVNPWIAVCSSEVKEFVNGYRKHWEEQNKKAFEETKSAHEKAKVQKLENQPSSRGESRKATSVENESRSNEKATTHHEMDDKSDKKNFKQKREKSKSEMAPVLTNKRGIAEENKNGNSMYVGSFLLKKGIKEDRGSLAGMNSSVVTTIKKQRNTAKTTSKNSEVFGTSRGWVVSIHSPTPNVLEARQKKKSEIREQSKRKRPATSKTGKKGGCEVLAAFAEVENKLSSTVKTKLKTLEASLMSEVQCRDEPKKNKTRGGKENSNVGSLLSFNNTAKVIIDKELNETAAGESSVGQKVAPLFPADPSSASSALSKNNAKEPCKVDIDPANFIKVAPKLVLSACADLQLQGGETDDLEKELQQKTVVEAFTGDDVVDDFRKEKEEAVDQSRPKQADLMLPGWGSWAGGAGSPCRRKKRRLLMKSPPAPQRHDDNKMRVIINEEKAFKVPEHQVTEVPYSFSSVSDFEASIRAPVGSTWIPETAHRKLIQPAVTTKLGNVIKPLDEEFLMKKKVALS